MKIWAQKKRLNSFFVEEVNNFLQVARLNNSCEIALKSFGHTVLWACALDEFYKKSYLNYDSFRKGDIKSEVVKGIRYARNRAIHQFTQLLHITASNSIPARVLAPLFEINWKSVTKLPNPDKGHKHKDLENFYTNYLENKPVRDTFKDLKGFFERVESEYE